MRERCAAEPAAGVGALRIRRDVPMILLRAGHAGHADLTRKPLRCPSERTFACWSPSTRWMRCSPSAWVRTRRATRAERHARRIERAVVMQGGQVLIADAEQTVAAFERGDAAVHAASEALERIHALPPAARQQADRAHRRALRRPRGQRRGARRRRPRGGPPARPPGRERAGAGNRHRRDAADAGCAPRRPPAPSRSAGVEALGMAGVRDWPAPPAW